MSNTHHVVSIVFNKVEGDSRVIKTAQAALNFGARATIVGVTNGAAAERKMIEGVSVVLLPHHGKRLKKQGLWGGNTRDIRIMVGSFVEASLPEILALEPSLIHSHDMLGLKVGATVARAIRAQGKRIPWIQDIHEFVAGIRGELQEQYIPYLVEWEEQFLAEADHLVTVSDALSKEISSRYKVPAPTVTYNTPNYSSFSQVGPDVRTNIGLPSDVPLVVFVGGATELRGCRTIVEAVSRLEGTHLVFVSAGSYVDEMAEFSKRLGMGGRFHTHPFVASDQVTTLIRTADVGIHGLVHYPNAEVALPNKMFEYLQAGIPLVVSDVESMKTFVERNKIGCSFVAGDVASCVKAIKRALANKDEYRGRITEDLKRLYSWEEQEKKVQGIYADLFAQETTQLADAEIKEAADWLVKDRINYNRVREQFLISQRKMSAAPAAVQSHLYNAKMLIKIIRRSGVRIAFRSAVRALMERAANRR